MTTPTPWQQAELDADAEDRRAALRAAAELTAAGLLPWAFEAGGAPPEQAWLANAEHAYDWLRRRVSLSGQSPDAPQWLRDQLDRIERNLEKIMSDVSDLQAADAALDTEITTFLADVATALTNAAGDASAVEAVVADINAKVAQLQAADPVSGTTASGSGDTPPAG